MVTSFMNILKHTYNDKKKTIQGAITFSFIILLLSVSSDRVNLLNDLDVVKFTLTPTVNSSQMLIIK